MLKAISGVLLLILAAVHIGHSEAVLLPALQKPGTKELLIGSVRIMSLQGGAILATFGILQLLGSMGRLKLEGAARYFPFGLIAINYFTFLLTAIFVYPGLLARSVPQIVIFGIVLVMQGWILWGRK